MGIIIYKNILLFLILCFLTLIQISVSFTVNDSTTYYIPPALIFDMSRYYNESSTINCLYIDYSSLRFFDLGELPSTEERDNKTNTTFQFNLCKFKHNNITSEIIMNGVSYNINNPFNITLIPKLNELTQINLSTKFDNKILNIIYNCSTTSSDNSTIISINNNNDISLILNNENCKHLYGYRFYLLENCGIYGYVYIVFGVLCLLYGFAESYFLFIIYTIFVLFELSLEVFDTLSYFFFYFDEDFAYNLLSIGCCIFGGIIGIICSMKFTYKKLIVSWFFGKVIYIIVFYLLIMPLYKHNMFIAREITLVTSLLLSYIMFIFVKENSKASTMVLRIAMDMIGSYLITFVGLNLIGGGLPFDFAVMYLHKYRNAEKTLYDNMASYRNCLWYFVVYIVLFVIGFIVLNSNEIIERLNDSLRTSSLIKSNDQVELVDASSISLEY